MVTTSDTESIQIEIVPSRFLMPASAQRLLNEVHGNGGIIRMTVHGPNLPRSVPFGPGKGVPIEENRNLLIEVGGQAFELFVKVGTIRLELESEKFFPGLKAACERALPNISCSIKRGKFFRTRQTVTDYAKYGRVEDKRMLGLIDPKAKKDRMAILSEVEVTVEDTKEE